MNEEEDYLLRQFSRLAEATARAATGRSALAEAELASDQQVIGGFDLELAGMMPLSVLLDLLHTEGGLDGARALTIALGMLVRQRNAAVPDPAVIETGRELARAALAARPDLGTDDVLAQLHEPVPGGRRPPSR